MPRRDIDLILRRAARGDNGRYRAIASRYPDGAPLGHCRYDRTRPDDPNDIVPHEHRRDLRGNLLTWYRFDNATGEHEQVGDEVRVEAPGARVPVCERELLPW